MCLASASGGYFGFIFLTGLTSRNTVGNGGASGFGSATGSGGFSSSFGLGTGFGLGSTLGNTIFDCTSFGSGLGIIIGVCLILRSGFGFCFFGGSGGCCSGAGSSRRTDITGSGGGSCQNCRGDQFTPQSKNGRVIFTPSANSRAPPNGRGVCSVWPGCGPKSPPLA